MCGVPVCRPIRTVIGPAASADLPFACSLQRAGRAGERVEEGVALRVHLDAAVSAERLPQHAPVFDQGLVVRLGPELVQQLRRALDVREEERDGAGR